VCLVPANVREKKGNLKALERIIEKLVFLYLCLVRFDRSYNSILKVRIILCCKKLICREINIQLDKNRNSHAKCLVAAV
jgi:hypothetical protein